MKLLYLTVIILTVLINLIFQHDIASYIHDGWNDQYGDVEIEELVINPLRDEASKFKDIDIKIPLKAHFEAKNNGTYKDIYDLIPIESLDNNLDVLFVGDSTISWGFDYEQFERSSGLRAASFSYSLNMPDQYLAKTISILAKCTMKEKGVIILSYANGMPGRGRGKRKQDKDLERFSEQVEDCTELRNLLVMRDKPQNENDPAKILLDRESYIHNVLTPLGNKLDNHNPFWNAKIGWKNFFPNNTEVQGEILSFYRWNPAFRVPYGMGPSWSYEKTDLELAAKDWEKELTDMEPEHKRLSTENIALWDIETIGRPVCHVIPITIINEYFRYWMWLDWTKSLCLLNYPEIIANEYSFTSLAMQNNQHYANTSGLLMSSALGKFFKDNISIIEGLNTKERKVTPYSVNDEMFIR